MLTSKQILRPPTPRSGTVERTSLVERLLRHGETGIVTIVAPAGYGKTTLMAQWARCDRRPTAWVTIDRADNDPAVLMGHLIAAVRDAGLIASDAIVDVRIESSDAMTGGVSLLIDALDANSTPGLLMLDQVDSLKSVGARDFVEELATCLPSWTTMVIGSRTVAPVPSASLRAHGALLELSVSDLAMSDVEALAVFEATGADLRGALSEVMEQTEGWPVGLYLVTLAMNAGAPRESAIRIRGDDRFIADYLDREILRRLPRNRLQFLVETSILDRLTGPLCDHVLQTTGSARVLEHLEDTNMLIVSLDRTRNWYRYHRLLRDRLLVGLDRGDPEIALGLHTRASEWFASRAMFVPAVHHAQVADDGDLAARVVSVGGRSVFATGASDTVLGWLDWFEQTGKIDRYPDIAVVGALARALTGDMARAERWSKVALEREDPDPTRTAGALGSLLRALLIPSGIADMARDAAAAVGGIEPGTDWYASALASQGLAHLWLGETEAADIAMQQAREAAEANDAPPTAALALAIRALIAIEHRQYEIADNMASLAVSIVQRFHIERSATSCLPYVVAAKCALRRGDVAEARQWLGEASSIRPLLTAALPGIAMQTLLEMATVYIGVADIAGARQVLHDATDIRSRRPDLGALTTRYDELKQRLASLPAGTVGASTLTTAELRVLPFLVTHLTFPEIGERLYVSRHTVKTQVMSIYRKLGVSSRGEAVAKAREVGLLIV